MSEKRAEEPHIHTPGDQSVWCPKTAQTPKCSPLPWKVIGAVVTEPDGTVVALFGDGGSNGPWPEDMRNAAFAAHCANVHDDLLAALQQIANMMATAYGNSSFHQKVEKIARAALTRAEKGG